MQLYLDPRVHQMFLSFMMIFICYVCISTLLQTKDDFRFIIPYVEFSKEVKGARPLVLDTSVVIDGRIADVAETRVIDQPMVIPRFVLQELQSIADSSDKLRRNRGRRGLDILNRLQKSPGIEVRIHDAEIPELAGIREVDQRLVVLAKHLGGKVVTNDYNLNKIARLQGVEVINLNDLANAMKPIVLPGESLTVKLLKRGEEQGQGIGYLDDGTMVVAEQGAYHLGETVRLTVTSVLADQRRPDDLRPDRSRFNPPRRPSPPVRPPHQESQSPAPGRHEHVCESRPTIRRVRFSSGQACSDPARRQRAIWRTACRSRWCVFDQGEAEEAFAGLAEAAAGTDGDVGFLQELHGEVDRARSATARVRASPSRRTSPPWGVSTSQPDALQAANQGVAPRSDTRRPGPACPASPCRSATIAATWTAWKIP